jgi:hypothetical protein
MLRAWRVIAYINDVDEQVEHADNPDSPDETLAENLMVSYLSCDLVDVCELFKMRLGLRN